MEFVESISRILTVSIEDTVATLGHGDSCFIPVVGNDDRSAGPFSAPLFAPLMSWWVTFLEWM